MAALPPNLPPPEDARDAYDVGAPRKTLRVLAAVCIPPVLAGAGGLFAMLMMTFATDAGVEDPERAGRLFVGVMVAIGLFGLCGIPAAFAVVAPPTRRRMWWRLCFGLAAVSLVGTLVCLGLYFGAVVK